LVRGDFAGLVKIAHAPSRPFFLSWVAVVLEMPERLPVSAATWWRGVKDGRYPKPIKLGPRTTCWLASDIQALIDRLAQGG